MPNNNFKYKYITYNHHSPSPIIRRETRAKIPNFQVKLQIALIQICTSKRRRELIENVGTYYKVLLMNCFPTHAHQLPFIQKYTVITFI